MAQQLGHRQQVFGLVVGDAAGGPTHPVEHGAGDPQPLDELVQPAVDVSRREGLALASAEHQVSGLASSYPPLTSSQTLSELLGAMLAEPLYHPRMQWDVPPAARSLRLIPEDRSAVHLGQLVPDV